MYRNYICVITFVLSWSVNSWPASFDLASGGYGLSFGNSPRHTGLRVNWRDQGITEITGVNLTLWKAGKNPEATINGLAAGLVAPEARDVRGAALGLLGAGAHRNVTGIAIGGLGSGAGETVEGVALGGLAAGAGGDFTGLGIGLFAGAGRRARGILLGGLAAGAGDSVTGIAVSLLRTEAGRSIDGVAAGAMVVSEEVRGVTLGALNGFGLTGWRLQRRTNDFAGVAIGIVNYTRHLRGVQIGLLNYAGDNPRWARLLPFVNLHL